MTGDATASERSIPVLDVGRRGAIGLYEDAGPDAAALVAGAMGGHVLLGIGGRLGDRLSRRWLERRRNPYLGEIAAVALAAGLPGVFLLNLIYEWACSTSAGPAPDAPGSRMIRVLDWGLPGIGKYVVIGRHEGDCGPYFNVTWPGYAGVLTAMAPGRFSAAINQAPRQAPAGVYWLDELIVHLAMLREPDTVPAAHLLRRVFEAAPDYDAAVAMLMDERIALATPALFTLSGCTPQEGCVVEAIGRRRRRTDAAASPHGVVGVANAWLSPGLPGVARDNALAWSTNTTVEANNAERRATICRLQRGAFAGVADLTPPVLNGHTVLAASANAAAGTLTVEALDQGGDRTALPRVVARGTIGALAAAGAA